MGHPHRNLLLIEALRRHRYPVTGKVLAAEIGVSLRTLYRDIQTLVGQGVPIEGEAGLGYVLRPGYLLPPLMFTTEEIEALALGSRFVAEHADKRLADSSRQAIAKILAVLPNDATDHVRHLGLFAGPVTQQAQATEAVLAVREAMRREVFLHFNYAKRDDCRSERRVKPIAIGFFEQARVLACWCVEKQDFRHFRLDRMVDVVVTEECFRPARRALLYEWKRRETIPDQA